jgi:hypothetical protein
MEPGTFAGAGQFAGSILVMSELFKRFGVLWLVLLTTVVAVVLAADHWQWRASLLLLIPLSLLGIRDYFQQRHTLMRNFPLIAHFRWLFEDARPCLRQYIVEGDLTGRPFNRAERSLVHAHHRCRSHRGVLAST